MFAPPNLTNKPIKSAFDLSEIKEFPITAEATSDIMFTPYRPDVRLASGSNKVITIEKGEKFTITGISKEGGSIRDIVDGTARKASESDSWLITTNRGTMKQATTKLPVSVENHSNTLSGETPKGKLSYTTLGTALGLSAGIYTAFKKPNVTNKDYIMYGLGFAIVGYFIGSAINKNVYK